MLSQLVQPRQARLQLQLTERLQIALHETTQRKGRLAMVEPGGGGAPAQKKPLPPSLR